MPQMFPILWTLLFTSTSILLVMMMSLIFFSFKPMPLKSNLSTPKMTFSWKW